MVKPAPNQDIVFVTGCTAGGIGWHLCAALADRGALVYASARRLSAMEGLEQRGCRLVQLDVTDNDSVARAVAEVMAEAGRIDGERLLGGDGGGGEGGFGCLARGVIGADWLPFGKPTPNPPTPNRQS
jgi:hypothetical protein